MIEDTMSLDFPLTVVILTANGHTLFLARATLPVRITHGEVYWPRETRDVGPSSPRALKIR